MTIKKAWEGLLEGAVRAFLDRYGDEDWTEEEALAAISELDERMNAKFRDEWFDLRAEKVKESFADAGQTAIPSEREQEVKDAVAEQLQDFADAGHRDEEEAMEEAEARGAGA